MAGRDDPAAAAGGRPRKTDMQEAVNPIPVPAANRPPLALPAA
jgi:hypothetical protein